MHKGHDPRDCTMVAYGGMTPLFAWTIAAQAGMARVVIPPHSAAFSAWGVVMADRVRRYARTVTWNLDDAEQAAEVNAVADQLIQQAVDDTRGVGLDPEDVRIRRIGAFRFMGQVWEIDLELDDAELTPEDARLLRERFVESYEKIYGAGTAWKGSPVILLDYEIIATAGGQSSRINPWTGGSPEPRPRTTREVHDPMTRGPLEVPIYDDLDVGAGARLEGPALIDGTDTTILVPAGVVGVRDGLGNLSLESR